MIRSALGPSPLDQNARALAAILSSRTGATPAGARAAEWAERAFRLAGADAVHLEKLGLSAQSENVIAEIRGREKPRDYVLVAATLDPSAANSLIAAENVAALIDAVRVIHNTGNISRRSIRFVLFASGNDRDGRFACVWAYIRAHKEDLDRIAAAVTIFPAEGALDGFSLEGRPDTLDAVRQALEPLRSLGIRDLSEGVKIPTDITPFWLEGVPTLVATGNPAASARGGNSPARTRASSHAGTSAKLHELKRRVAVAAVAAYALADAETRIGPRQSRTQVEQSITSMGLARPLSRAGLWLEWRVSESDTSH